jgi:hypothetical protein
MDTGRRPLVVLRHALVDVTVNTDPLVLTTPCVCATVRARADEGGGARRRQALPDGDRHRPVRRKGSHIPASSQKLSDLFTLTASIYQRIH